MPKRASARATQRELSLHPIRLLWYTTEPEQPTPHFGLAGQLRIERRRIVCVTPAIGGGVIVTLDEGAIVVHADAMDERYG